MIATMFTKTVKVELTPETTQSLAEVQHAIDALADLIGEVLIAQRDVLDRIKGEIAVQVMDAAGADGVDVFEENEEPYRRSSPATGKAAAKPLPEVMQKKEDWDPDNQTPEEQRKRSTPFTRAPRHVQVQWLLEVMSDGQWYAAISLAREYADEERTFRYLKGALTGRMKEMSDEGLLERRDSHTKGSMFEYRLIQRPK